MDTESKINREFHRHIMPQAWGTMQCRWRGLRTRCRRRALVYTPCRLCARAHTHTLFRQNKVQNKVMPQETRNCGRVGRRLHLERSGRHSLPVYRSYRLPPDIIGRRLGLGLRVGSDIYYYRFYTYIYIYMLLVMQRQGQFEKQTLFSYIQLDSHFAF